MGVFFTATQEPVGFRMSCAWDETVYATYEDALNAASAHPEGGCAEGREFFAGISHLDDRDQLQAENEVRDRTGCWATACTHDRQWVEAVYPEEAPEVQMSWFNAMDVLRALGFTTGHDVVADAEREVTHLGELFASMAPPDVEWCGSVDPDDLHARILIADALVGDGGVPAQTLRTKTGATVVVGGRNAGYIHARLGQLAELAAFAKDRGLRVTWS